jgi:hypothetical protein
MLRLERQQFPFGNGDNDRRCARTRRRHRSPRGIDRATARSAARMVAGL